MVPPSKSNILKHKGFFAANLKDPPLLSVSLKNVTVDETLTDCGGVEGEDEGTEEEEEEAEEVLVVASTCNTANIRLRCIVHDFIHTHESTLDCHKLGFTKVIQKEIQNVITLNSEVLYPITSQCCWMSILLSRYNIVTLSSKYGVLKKNRG